MEYSWIYCLVIILLGNLGAIALYHYEQNKLGIEWKGDSEWWVQTGYMLVFGITYLFLRFGIWVWEGIKKIFKK